MVNGTSEPNDCAIPIAMAVLPVLLMCKHESVADSPECANSPWWTGNQNGSACDLALLDHFQDDRCSFPRLFLSNQSLGGTSRFESVYIDTETADV